jgi:hypothetical protein
VRRRRTEGTRRRAPKPALPELERTLVEMAGGQAERSGTRTSSRRRLRRGIALGGVAVGAAAALMILLLGGGGGGVRPERASAADLSRIAETLPHLQLAGPWQITTTELTPGGGRFEYLFEGPDQWFHATEAEVRWHSGPIAERARQLESEGFAFATTWQTEISRISALINEDSAHFSVPRDVQVYADRGGGGREFPAVGLWWLGGRPFELRATVLSLQEFEYLMQRLELLTGKEWFIALQPGGGKWLADTAGGTIEKIEMFKVGETPDGDPIFREGALIHTPTGKDLDFEAPLPTIYREGDKIRMVIQEPPEGLEIRRDEAE